MKDKNNEYDKFIKQKRFENDLGEIFKSNNDNNEFIIEKKQQPKKNDIIKPVSHPQPKDKSEKPPKEFTVTPMVKQAEKFVPNDLGKKEAGIDINALAISLKADPNFMSKMQPKSSMNIGSGLGKNEAQLMIDTSIAAISSVSADNVIFDKTSTTLSGTNLQSTTEELDERLTSVSADVITNTVNIIALSATPSPSQCTSAASIQFDANYTSASNPAWSEGLLFYDYDNKTLASYGDQSAVTLQIGQEGHIRAINKTGTTILNGKPVEILSADSNLPSISLAQSTVNDSHIIGITTQDIPDNSIGLVNVYGVVNDINLTAFTDGDSIYLSTSAGEFVNTPPPNPYSTIEIGHVISNAVAGKLIVSIKNKPLSIISTNQIYVSVSGTDSSAVAGTQTTPYKTIEFALSQITDNSTTNKYVILVGPGLHYENNPVQLKSYVSLMSIGGRQVTTIISQNDDDLFLGAHKTTIDGVGLKGRTGKYCINVSTSGNCKIHNIAIQDGNGVCVNHVNAVVKMRDIVLSTSTGTINNGFDISSGTVIIRTIDVFDDSDIDNLFSIRGGDSIVTIKDVVSFSNNVDTLIDITNSATVDVDIVTCRNVTNGIVMNDGSTLKINCSTFNGCTNNGFTNTSGTGIYFGMQGVTFQDSTNYDFYADASGSVLYGTGYVQLSKVFAGLGVAMYGMAVDLFAGDEGLNVLGELHVGTPEGPSESVFGEGDSYTRGMLVYTYNASTSAYTDVSEEAGSSTGSTFAFPGSAVDNAIYIGSTLKNQSDYVNHC